MRPNMWQIQSYLKEQQAYERGSGGRAHESYEVTRDATGKEISRVEKSNTITKAPVTEVIARGTKSQRTRRTESNGKRRRKKLSQWAMRHSI